MLLLPRPLATPRAMPLTSGCNVFLVSTRSTPWSGTKYYWCEIRTIIGYYMRGGIATRVKALKASTHGAATPAATTTTDCHRTSQMYSPTCTMTINQARAPKKRCVAQARVSARPSRGTRLEHVPPQNKSFFAGDMVVCAVLLLPLLARSLAAAGQVRTAALWLHYPSAQKQKCSAQAGGSPRPVPGVLPEHVPLMTVSLRRHYCFCWDAAATTDYRRT